MLSKLRLLTVAFVLVGLLTACQVLGEENPSLVPTIPPPQISLGYYIINPASDVQPDFFTEAYRGCQGAYLN